MHFGGKKPSLKRERAFPPFFFIVFKVRLKKQFDTLLLKASCKTTTSRLTDIGPVDGVRDKVLYLAPDLYTTTIPTKKVGFVKKF